MLKTYTINDLPPEVLALIFRKLEHNQVLRLMLVCKKFLRAALNNPVAWNLPVDDKVINYLNLCSIRNQFDSHIKGKKILDMERYQFFASEITAQAKIAKYPFLKLAPLNRSVKSNLISNASDSDPLTNKKRLFLFLINLALFVLFVLMVKGVFDNWFFASGKYFAKKFDCRLKSNSEDFVQNVVAYVNHIYLGRHVVGLAVGIFINVSDQKMVNPILVKNYYNHFIPDIYARQASNLTSGKKFLLKTLHYRDFISSILAFLILAGLIINGSFNLREHYCLQNIQETLGECFQECAYGAKRSSFFWSIMPNMGYSFLIGLLLGYSLFSVCTRLVRVAVNRFGSESNNQLPSYRI